MHNRFQKVLSECGMVQDRADTSELSAKDVTQIVAQSLEAVIGTRSACELGQVINKVDGPEARKANWSSQVVNRYSDYSVRPLMNVGARTASPSKSYPSLDVARAASPS